MVTCFCDFDSCETYGDCCSDYTTYCDFCKRDCPVGFYNKDCDNSPDFGYNCAECTKAEDNEYYTTDGDLTDSCKRKACATDTCEFGEYLAGCAGNSSGACTNCTVPDGQFVNGSASDFKDDCDVVTCSECPNGFYEIGACTRLSDTNCTACSNATAGSYLTSNGGDKDDCEETKCSMCPVGQYV